MSRLRSFSVEDRAELLHWNITEYHAHMTRVPCWGAEAVDQRTATWQNITDIAFNTYKNDTALVRAVKSRGVSRVKTLLESGADVDRGDPLTLAQLLGLVDVTEMLLGAGARIMLRHEVSKWNIRFITEIESSGAINAMMRAEAARRVEATGALLRERLESLQRRGRLVDFGPIDVVTKMMAE